MSAQGRRAAGEARTGGFDPLRRARPHRCFQFFQVRFELSHRLQQCRIDRSRHPYPRPAQRDLDLAGLRRRFRVPFRRRGDRSSPRETRSASATTIGSSVAAGAATVNPCWRRDHRCHLNSWLVLSRCRNAITATNAPGSNVNYASRHLYPTLYCRRPEVSIRITLGGRTDSSVMTAYPLVERILRASARRSVLTPFQSVQTDLAGPLRLD